MSLRFIRQCSADYFLLNLRKMTGMLLLLVISGWVCGFVGVLYGEQSDRRNGLEQALGGKAEDIGIMMSANSDAPSWGRIVSRLQEDDRIEGIGCSTNGTFLIPDGPVGKVFESNVKVLRSHVGIIRSSVGMISLLDAKLDQDEVLGYLQKGIVPVYLGDGIPANEVDVGTEFLLKKNEGENVKAVIAGRLSKGLTWVRTSDFQRGFPDDYIIALDQAVISFWPEDTFGSEDPFILRKKPVSEWTELSECVEKAAYGSVISLRKATELLTGRESQTAELRNYLRRLLIIMVCVSVLSLVSVLTVITIQYRKMFGIWYACGATQGEVCGVLVFNAVILFVLSESLTIGVGSLMLRILIVPEGWPMTLSLLKRYSVPIVFIVQFATIAIGSIVPLRMVRKEAPSELVNGFVE